MTPAPTLGEDLDAELARRGMAVSAEGCARAGRQRAQVEQQWPRGRRVKLRERMRQAAQEIPSRIYD